MKLLVLALLLVGLAGCTSTPKKEMTYKVDGVTHTGYVASGAKEGEKKPGIIVVHEWWGHNDYARKRVDMLADLGYVAMSIDMYGEGKQADHPKDAGAFMKESMSNIDLAEKRFKTALEILKSRDDVDTSKIAGIGYCFGGAVVLHMARAGVEMNLVASFHGSLKAMKEANKSTFKPSHVMVFNGAKDPMITKEDIAGFAKEMKGLDAKYTFENYPNALHAFTNKGATEKGKKFKLPLAYDKEADMDSWKQFTEALSKL